jgi:hypothetical protein
MRLSVAIRRCYSFVNMWPWGTQSDSFRHGVERDPQGGGAAWARIAIAARLTHPLDAIECARRALATNPDAWKPWYEVFIAHAAHRVEGAFGV